MFDPMHLSPHSYHERQAREADVCSESNIVERMGRGDGVNLRSRFMPSVSEERAPPLAAVPAKQRTFFPLQR